MQFDKPTLITLTAPTCSGKSFLLEYLTDQVTPYRRTVVKGLCERIVSTTTRKSREGEEEGKDYYFISEEESIRMEQDGLFAELITFRGTRYGVTKVEMAKKMASDRPPIVILEPQGLKIYEKLCQENGWGIYKVFVSTSEPVRIQRLNHRTSLDMQDVIRRRHEFQGDELFEAIKKVISTHTNRMESIMGEERRWQGMSVWDAIITGEDRMKAIADLKQGIAWRNQRTKNPTPFNGYFNDIA